MMLPGLPPLTADAHEFRETWTSGEFPEVPPGAGWVLVGMVQYTAHNDDSKPGYLWSRRKDGRPLVCSHPDAESLQRVITTLSADLQAAEQERNDERARVASNCADIIDALVKLARAAVNADSPDERDAALDRLCDWLEDYDATQGTS